VVDLKFAHSCNQRRSELQIRKPHWKHQLAGVLIDSEVRSGSPLTLTNF
jgi:hypothetical protein